MSLKKMAMIFLATVLVLGGIGSAFAAWTDSIQIEGTVNTGSVELVVEGYSGTWVYKMPDHGIEVIDGIWDGEERPKPEGAFVGLIAYAEAKPGSDEKSIDVEYNNLFPGIDFSANALIHYNGSIPAIVWSEWVSIEPAESPLIPFVTDWAGVKRNGTEEYEPVHLASGVQMHHCDMLKLVMNINLPQDNDLMGLNGSFEVKINAIQWNKSTDETYELTFDVIGFGQATGAGVYAAGDVVEIEAIPDPGNIFQFWSAPAGTIGNEFDATTTFTMPDQDVTVTVRFMPEGQFEERDRDHTDLCITQTGGVGILVDTWDISEVPEGTALDLYFHALTQPDRWTVWYGSELIFASGWVSTDPGYWSAQPLFSAEGVQNHHWHANVEESNWMTWGGPYPNGGLYAGIVTKEAGKNELVIRTEGGEPGTVWYYKLCQQP